MKKYILTSIIIILFLSSCVKDEQPAPAPPPPIDYSSIFINELMTKDSAQPYYVDGLGEGADWIELYNTGVSALNISGIWITDLAGSDADYVQIPSTNEAITTIPPKGYLVVICGAKNADGSDVPAGITDGKVFVDFGLSASKDHTVAIYNPDKVEIDQSDDFNGLETNKSFGRETDAAATWIVLAEKSPGAANGGGGTGPVVGNLVINEFMCSNDTTFILDETGPDNYPDWIEIYNTGDTPIDIGGWYLTESLAEPMLYQIPTDIPEQTLIPGHGFLILKANGVGEGISLNFKLGSGGDDIGLSIDGVTFVDALSYGTGAGGGSPVDAPPTDMSAGRTTDGGAAWVVFDPNTETGPTPGSANGN